MKRKAGFCCSCYSKSPSLGLGFTLALSPLFRCNVLERQRPNFYQSSSQERKWCASSGQLQGKYGFYQKKKNRQCYNFCCHTYLKYLSGEAQSVVFIHYLPFLVSVFPSDTISLNDRTFFSICQEAFWQRSFFFNFIWEHLFFTFIPE